VKQSRTTSFFLLDGTATPERGCTLVTSTILTAAAADKTDKGSDREAGLVWAATMFFVGIFVEAVASKPALVATSGRAVETSAVADARRRAVETAATADAALVA